MSPKKIRRHIRQQRKERRRAIREQERAAKLKAAQEAAKARAELKEEQLQERRRSAEEKQARRAKRRPAESSSQEGPTERASGSDQGVAAGEGAAPEGRTAPGPGSAGAAPGSSASVSNASVSNASVSSAPGGGSLTEEPVGSAVREGRHGAGRSRARSRGRRAAAVVITGGVLAVGGGSFAGDLAGSSAPLGQIGAAEVPALGTGVHRVCPPMPGQADSLSSEGLLDYAERDDSASSLFRTVLLDTDGAGTFPDAATATLTEDGREEGEGLAEAPDPQDLPQDAPGPEALLGEREPLIGETPDLTDPSLLDVSAAPQGGSLAAGALYEYSADSGPVAGLAVSSCAAPQRSQWFFGPELGRGSTSLLTLANPSDRDATVEVTSFDDGGARAGSGVRSLVVPGQSVRSLNVSAIAGGEQELGLSVEASGAPVAAQLQSSRASGSQGDGVEFLPGLAETGREHRLLSVPVAGEGSPAEVWLHAPGEEQTTVELQVFGPEGQVTLENPSVFTVEGGELDTVPLEGLESGVYDIVLRAEEPVHAAVRTEGGAQEQEDDPELPEMDEAQDSAEDFSWAGPAPVLEAGSGTLLPGSAESSLRLVGGREGGTVTYRLMDGEGEVSEPQEAEVPAEGAVTLSAEDLEDVMTDAAAVLVDEAEGEVHAALLTEDEAGRFSITAVEELADRGTTVPVRLRD